MILQKLASLGTTEETTRIMRKLKVATKIETKEFMEEFTNHLKNVLDTLEGRQKVFYVVESDIAKSTVTVRLGSTLGLNDLPSELTEQIMKETREEIAKEHGEVNIICEGTLPPKPTKSLEERIKDIYDAHPEPHPPIEANKA